MAPKVYLSEELCAKARDKVDQLMECENEKGIHIQLSAAKALMDACQTQARYNLAPPRTPADYERAATHPNTTGAKVLEAMTPEDLLEKQKLLTRDFRKKQAS